MRTYLIGFFELVFLTGTLFAAGRLWIVEKDHWTSGMLLLVCVAFIVFTAAGYWYAWKIRASTPVPEAALRRAAAGRTVKVGGADHLPSDAVDAVMSVTDADAPPSWLGLGQSVLVSLGLVGTFLGLTIGIYSAAEGILSPDPNEVQEAMGVLMGGAKLAFAKSLAGVVAAMIWSFRYGQTEDLWAERRNRARAWLDATLPPLSSERLLAMTLVHLKASANQQATRDAAIQAEVVRIGPALSDVLTRLHSVEATLTARLSAVEQAVRSPGEDDVVTTLDSLRNTVSQLADVLPDRMGSPIAGGISVALAASLNPKLDDVAKGIRALSEARGGLEQRVGDQVSGQVTELGTALSALQDAVVTLKEQLSVLPLQVRTDVQRGTNAASESLSRELVDAGQKIAARLSGAAADLAAGGDRIAISVGELQSVLQRSPEPTPLCSPERTPMVLHLHKFRPWALGPRPVTWG